MPALIVFSPVPWEGMYQRPRQLLSRLAQTYPVVFIEEPRYEAGRNDWETERSAPNVSVYRPWTSCPTPGFHDAQLEGLRPLLRELVASHPDHLAWFHTPLALPLLQELHPRAVVYDCLDVPTLTQGAPKVWLQREYALLKRADLVFTAGSSLYRAQRERHAKVHCFPDRVDASHFAQALDRTSSHPAHKDIPGPRLGFYGVIDARFDGQLIAQVAAARPSWQFVLLGPVIGVEPSALPQGANIHYLGAQPYAALPQFLAGWDVGLLPYRSTSFVSPARALEYMAAEVPIVTTPLTDILEVCGELAYSAGTVAAFIAACESAMTEGPAQRADKIAAMRACVAAASWDSAAAGMQVLLEEMLPTPVAPEREPLALVPPRHLQALPLPDLAGAAIQSSEGSARH